MSERTIGQRYRIFKGGQSNEHMFTMKSEDGWPSLVSDDLVQSVGRNICESRRLISELSCEFSRISRTLPYETITVRISCHYKFSGKVYGEGAQNAENSFGHDFSERYHKDGDEFLNHIRRVTADETSVFNCGYWNLRAVKAVDANTFTGEA
jgi:hypothetical protein